MTHENPSDTGKSLKIGQAVHNFATAPDGSTIRLVRIENGGTSVNVMSWGASIQDVRRAEFPHSLVLGSPEFAPYLTVMRYFGAIVGPVANRIAHGRFRIGDQDFALDRNENGITTLHGGSTGIGVRNWRFDGHDEQSCSLSIRHADGEGGFPGNMDISAIYSIDVDGALRLEIRAITDAPTYCNLAHHSYWNLDGTPDLTSHRLLIHADQYLPVDVNLIPLGRFEEVAGTRFDFRTLAPVCRSSEPSIDHNFCLIRSGAGVDPVCLLEAGRMRLEIESTEPGLQVYDGSAMNTGKWKGHAGAPYGSFAGIALEPQNWPDAPNHPDYPSALLQPGETYHQTSVFRLKATTS